MLDKVKNFYEEEYKSTLRWLSSEHCKTKEDKIKSINYAIQRCLGIALFVQGLDTSFEEIDTLYTEYRKKFCELLNMARSMK